MTPVQNKVGLKFELIVRNLTTVTNVASNVYTGSIMVKTE